MSVRKRTIICLALLVALGSIIEAGQAAFSGRNGRIAFVWNADTRVAPQSCLDIFAIAPNGSDRVRLTAGCPWEYSDPSYSDTGSQIVFVRRYVPFPDHPQGAGIYVMKADGSQVRRITRSMSDEEPSFSPDGRWVVFDRFLRRSRRTQVFLASLEGSRIHQLTHGQGASQATFFPGGRMLAFVGSNSNLYTMRVDGYRVRQLTHSSGGLDRWYADPDISPDGRRIVSVCGEGDGFGSAQQICVMRADGTHMEKLTEGPGLAVADPAFSPDGREIAFIAQLSCRLRSCGNTGVALFAIGVDGSHRRRIYNLGPHQELGSLGISWQGL
jgi:Tol biopolymer transport system component